MRAGTRRAFYVSIAATITGCAMPRAEPPSLLLRVADGWFWVEGNQIDHLHCETGLLTCDDAGGRLSRRRCRCFE